MAALELAGYRTAIGALLASASDAAVWTTAICDAGLTEALREFNDGAPAEEVSFTVTVAGHSQDLSGISGLRRLVALAWPWDSDYGEFEPLVSWRLTAPSVVWIVGDQPAVGDLIRVRYQKGYQVKDLASAGSSTVPIVAEQVLVRGAAGWCALLRARQDVEGSSLPPYSTRNLVEWGGARLVEFREGLASLGGAATPWVQWFGSG